MLEYEGRDDARLTQLSTHWAIVVQAHTGTPHEAAAAQAALLARYSGAVRRYLLGALRDAEAADELGQEFALRFLRGDFHRADPARGRFRDFLRRALRNLVADHHRRRKARPGPLGDDPPDRTAAPGQGSDSDFEREFAASWRAELLARAWEALEALQRRSGQPYHAVLKLRVQHPELRSSELAERLSAGLGRSIAAGALRMALQRSRDRFVAFLLEEVTGGLDRPTSEDVDRELIELGLLEVCRPARARLGRGPRAEGGR